MTAEPDPVASEAEVIKAIAAFPRPVARSELERVLAGRVGARVLRTRLATLVRDGRLRKLGDRRWTTYALPESGPKAASGTTSVNADDALGRSLSRSSRALLGKLARPVSERTASGYRPAYADAYVPGTTHWLDTAERERLHRLGTVAGTAQPAGTYARNILDRLLIDLSFNSSRLESNTYSLLDTRRLL